MSGQPSEDKKSDFSNLPRGAISIKGLPVNRNARLPSIRTPRDLTLGSQPKRTFLPNIPIRREKRVTDNEKTPVQPQIQNSSRNSSPKAQGRGNGHKREFSHEKAAIIQTEGSVFGEGIAADASRRERQRDSYQSYGRTGSATGITIKKEQSNSDLSRTIQDLNNLLRDDFIDDEEEVEDKLKPVIFPNELKYEDSLRKKEEAKEHFEKPVKPTFDPEVARNMGFDVEKVAKFIKKEKGMEEQKDTAESSFAQLPNEEIFKRLNLSQSELMLLQFPSCVTIPESNMDSDSTQSQRSQPNGETNLADEQKKNAAYLSSLSEGHIGKLQLLKSGKIRLVLGALKFDLDSITPLISKHEIASVRTNTDSGDLVVLGSMEQKIIFDPDVESLCY